MAENLLSEGVVKQISDVNETLSEMCSELERALEVLSGKMTSFEHVVKQLNQTLKNNESTIQGVAVASDGLSDDMETMIKTFSSFKDIIAGGKFWENMSGGVSSLRDKLTGLQKGALTVTAAFAEFDVISEAFEGLVSESEDVSEGIGKIAVASTAAGTAMYAALGPVGPVIAVITGIVGAIKGISDAFDEIQAESTAKAIGDALSNPGGMPIEDLTDSYVTMIERIGGGFESLAEKATELENITDQMQKVNESIGVISFALENGANVTEDTIDKLDTLFNQLLDGSKSKFDQEYDIIMMGLAGSFGDALNAAGIATEEYIAILEQYKSSNERAYDEMLEKQKILDEQLENGQITQEEYATSLSEQIDQYIVAAGSVDEYAGEIDSLNASVKDINFGLLVDEGNKFNTDRMRLQFSSLAEESENAKSVIETSSQGMRNTLQNIYQWAKEQGDIELINKTSTAISAEEEAVRTATGEVDSALIEYSEMVQNSLLEDIPNVVDQALKEREEKGWLYKLFHSEEDDVKAALEKYQTDVLDVADEELKKMYADANIELSTYASDKGNEIIESFICSTDVNSDEFGFIQEGWKDTLNGYIDQTLCEVSPNAQAAGETLPKTYFNSAQADVSMSDEMVQSYDRCVSQSFTTLATNGYLYANEAGKNTGQGFIDGIGGKLGQLETKTNNVLRGVIETAEKVLEIHSPSKVFFRLGEFTIEGYECGLESMYREVEQSLGRFSGGLKASVELNSGISDLYHQIVLNSSVEFDDSRAKDQFSMISETNKLIREILSAVSEGKNIVLDGKVLGKALQNQDTEYFNRTGTGMFQH